MPWLLCPGCNALEQVQHAHEQAKVLLEQGDIDA